MSFLNVNNLSNCDTDSFSWLRVDQSCDGVLLNLDLLRSPSSNLKLLSLLLSQSLRTGGSLDFISSKLLMLQQGSRDPPGHCDSGFDLSVTLGHGEGNRVILPGVFNVVTLWDFHGFSGSSLGSYVAFGGREIRNFLSRACLSSSFRSSCWALSEEQFYRKSNNSTVHCLVPSNARAKVSGIIELTL